MHLLILLRQPSLSLPLLNLPTPPPHPHRHQPCQLVYDLTLAPDVDLPSDSQTNIHSNNAPRHASSPNNKHPQSVSHHKPHPSTRTTFLHYLFIFPRIQSLYKQGTGDDLANTLCDLHYECSEGRGLGGSLMEGGVGWGSNTW